MVRILLCCVTMIFSAAVAFAAQALEIQPKPKALSALTQKDLQQLLTDFAAKNNVSLDDVVRHIAIERFSFRSLRKGGVALLNRTHDGALYAFADGLRNTLLMEKGVRWEGAPSNSRQLVVASPAGVVGEVTLPEQVEVSRLTFIWFAPDEIRWFQPSEGVGARVQRFLKSSPALDGGR